MEKSTARAVLFFVAWRADGLRSEASCSIRRVKKKAAKKRRPTTGKAGPKNVEEYLAGIPEAARGHFLKLRATIQSVVPAEAVETISYKIPAFRHGRVLLWFAAFSNHCSLFPTAAVTAEFKDELKGFSTSKGTVHFPLDKPLPTGLVKKMVKARVRQNKARTTK